MKGRDVPTNRWEKKTATTTRSSLAAATTASKNSNDNGIEIAKLDASQVVQDVSIAGINLPLRRLKEYESLRAMEDEGSSGGGQGRHRIFLAEYDDETVVLKGYALVRIFVFFHQTLWWLFLDMGLACRCNHFEVSGHTLSCRRFCSSFW